MPDMLTQILQWAGPPALLAAGWGAGRLVTRAREKEEAERLSSTVDLVERLNRLGMTLDEARTLQRSLANTKRAVPPEILAKLGWSQILAAPVPGDEKVNMQASRVEGLDYEITETTTAGMIGQLADVIDGFDSKIDAELEALVELGDAQDAAELQSAQTSWLAFRKAEATYAASVFRGGTAASLASGSRVAELCIDRLRFLRVERKNREAL